MKRKILRHSLQAIILCIALMVPIFDIFRFDIANLELYLFRQLWSFAPQGHYMSGAGGDPNAFIFKGILPTLLMLVTIPVWGAIFGRALCGWTCAMGSILELGDFFNRKISRIFKAPPIEDDSKPRSRFYDVFIGIVSLLVMVCLLLIAACCFSGFFIAPAEIWTQIRTFSFTPFFLVVASALTTFFVVTYLVARRTFCSYVCLMGLTLIIPAVASPFSMRIRFDKKRGRTCTNCKGCEAACFMDLKPRSQRKVNPKCVNCGECITACEKQLGKKGKLLYYGFGPDKK